jgi:hypothetical protein
MEQVDVPIAIKTCWLAWMAVHTSDQAGLVAQLGLTDAREVSWGEAVGLVDDTAHDRAATVVVTPTIKGWTLIVGPWCALPDLHRTALVTNLCRELSVRHGKAQAYFHSEECDDGDVRLGSDDIGEAWLIAENGVVIRRWISEYPELASGEPFGVERRLLTSYGISGKPEDLDLDDDADAEDLADWFKWGDCQATVVAEESSLDPTRIGAETQASGRLLAMTTPPFEPLDPVTETAPYGGWMDEEGWLRGRSG